MMIYILNLASLLQPDSTELLPIHSDRTLMSNIYYSTCMRRGKVIGSVVVIIVVVVVDTKIA